MNGNVFIRCEQKMDFPHYPQSYPQKRERKALFFMVFPVTLWITFAKDQLIHRILNKTLQIFHSFSRALSTKNMKIWRHLLHKIVINQYFTV